LTNITRKTLGPDEGKENKVMDSSIYRWLIEAKPAHKNKEFQI